MHCAGDLYQRLDVRLTGLARGTAPHTPDGALAALHLADLALWLAPRAPFVRELHLRLPSTPAPTVAGAATPARAWGRKVGHMCCWCTMNKLALCLAPRAPGARGLHTRQPVLNRL